MSADYRTHAILLMRQEIDVTGEAAIAEHRRRILETLRPRNRKDRQNDTAPPPPGVFNSHPT